MNEQLAVLEDTIYNNPLALLALENAEEIGLAVLPYSIGIELECFQKTSFNKDAFLAIPDILEVRVDTGEQRFRIPKGLKGLICFWNICEKLYEYSELNMGSGNHVHCDFSECDFKFIDQSFVDNNKEWVLKELDTWNYKGKYNGRTLNNFKGGWAGFRSNKKSLEFRIIEMSFSYSVLLKRIVHICEISKKLKANLELYAISAKYKHLLEKTTKKPHLTTQIPEDNIEEVIKLRKIKI